MPEKNTKTVWNHLAVLAQTSVLFQLVGFIPQLELGESQARISKKDPNFTNFNHGNAMSEHVSFNFNETTKVNTHSSQILQATKANGKVGGRGTKPPVSPSNSSICNWS